MHVDVVVIFYTKQSKAQLLLSLKSKSKQSQFSSQYKQFESSNRIYLDKNKKSVYLKALKFLMF